MGAPQQRATLALLLLQDGKQLERARLHRLRLAALESLCRLELECGGQARIVDQLQTAAVCEPLREPLHELLILAL